MSAELLAKLRPLQYQRSDTSPFATHNDFLVWSDSVLPLLSFNQALKKRFQMAVSAANSNRSMYGEGGAIPNINSAIGILNQAVTTLETPMAKEPKPLEATEKITLHWLYKNAHVNLYLWFFGLLGVAVSGGFWIGNQYASITAAHQSQSLSTVTSAAPPKAPANAVPTTIENVKKKEASAQARSNVAGTPQ